MTAISISNFHPVKSKVPSHIGLIPDGTRRWAKRESINLLDAYSIALNKVLVFPRYYFSKGILNASIYCSSIQNFSRSSEEVEIICKSQNQFLKEKYKDFIHEFSTKTIIAGNLEILPKYFRETLLDIQSSTIKNGPYKINLCVAYNPIEEIQNAISQSKDANFLPNLWVKEPLDFIIRTSGANLLSNFLPLQSGFARLYWIEKLFPDVDIKDYDSIFNDFIQIERKFGE